MKNRSKRYKNLFASLKKKDLKKHNGEFITFDDNVKNNEGLTPLKGRTILFGFKKSDDAERWYSDPEYQALSEHRRNGTTTNFLSFVKQMKR